MVKEDIDRLLEAGFIYPVVNSEWVSPIGSSEKGRSGRKSEDPGMSRFSEAQRLHQEGLLPNTLYRYNPRPRFRSRMLQLSGRIFRV